MIGNMIYMDLYSLNADLIRFLLIRRYIGTDVAMAINSAKASFILVFVKFRNICAAYFESVAVINTKIPPNAVEKSTLWLAMISEAVTSLFAILKRISTCNSDANVLADASPIIL